MIYVAGDGAAGNPFAVLTAVVAPAILTNACSVLALGTSNRLARVVDRTRVVARELAAIGPSDSHYKSWVAQLDGLQVRTRMLVKATSTSKAAAMTAGCSRNAMPVASSRLRGR